MEKCIIIRGGMCEIPGIGEFRYFCDCEDFFLEMPDYGVGGDELLAISVALTASNDKYDIHVFGETLYVVFKTEDILQLVTSN